MPRQLLILRHAKSAWDSAAATDFDRPLSKRGKHDAIEMGRWLHRQGLIPDYVLSSPAKRAKQTVRRVCEELGIEEQQIHWERRIYEAVTEELCAVLAECPAEADTVLMVGHNPGFEELVLYLCGAVPVPEDGKLLPTATLAQLSMPADWSRLAAESARLHSITRPHSLPDA